MEDDERSMTLEERNFAAEVKRLREEAQWSQAELLQKMHEHGLTYLNQTALSRIENGRRQVRMIESLALMRIFNRPLTDMTLPDPRGDLLDEATHIINLVQNSEDRLRSSAQELRERQLSALRVMEKIRNAFFHDLNSIGPDVLPRLGTTVRTLAISTQWPPAPLINELLDDENQFTERLKRASDSVTSE